MGVVVVGVWGSATAACGSSSSADRLMNVSLNGRWADWPCSTMTCVGHVKQSVSKRTRGFMASSSKSYPDTNTEICAADDECVTDVRLVGNKVFFWHGVNQLFVVIVPGLQGALKVRGTAPVDTEVWLRQVLDIQHHILTERKRARESKDGSAEHCSRKVDEEARTGARMSRLQRKRESPCISMI